MNTLEKIVSWAKRRGFVFPSSEIYGGLGGVYDFGPYGVELKNNLKKFWRKKFVEERDDIVGLESAVLMNQMVWKASGHEADFKDPLVECKKCHRRFKAEDVGFGIKGKGQKPKIKCPECGGELTEPRQFNLMLKTYIGPVEDSAAMTYLRPETAQGMFVDFKQILETSRKKIPFGIAQVGKSFRNEITPGNFIYRMREFEIAEIEYFVRPGEDDKWFDHWLLEWQNFFIELGINKTDIKLHEHPKKNLAHYSKKTVDLLYNFPFGWQELAGVADRTDYDLRQHQRFSGKDLQYFDQERNKKYTPYVIEPTLGIERAILAILISAFEEVKGGRTKTTESVKEEEIVLHLHPALAPVKVAVLPLVKKLSDIAKDIYQMVKKEWVAEYDEDGTIGRRYRRQDEIGTPFCITIDFDTLKDKKVTIRDRDTMKQERVEIVKINQYLNTNLHP